jgi:hypothetical protein
MEIRYFARRRLGDSVEVKGADSYVVDCAQSGAVTSEVILFVVRVCFSKLGPHVRDAQYTHIIAGEAQ